MLIIFSKHTINPINKQACNPPTPLIHPPINLQNSPDRLRKNTRGAPEQGAR